VAAEAGASAGVWGTRSITTPLSKRISSPFSLTSRRLALILPFDSFTSTALSLTILFFLMSTAASLIHTA